MIDPVYASLLIAALGFGLNLYTVSKGNAKNAEQTGRVLQSVDNLKESVTEIKQNLRDSSRQIDSVEHRVTAIEGRVTSLEEKSNER